MSESEPSYWTFVAWRMESPNATNPGHSQDVADLNHALETRLLVSMIRKHFREGRKLLTLDIGAGMGRFSEVAARFGQVHALEPSELAETLRTRLQHCRDVTIIHEAFEQFNPSELYDLIIVSGVFMKPTDLQTRELMHKAAACLRPGGLFFIRDYLSPSVKKVHGDQRYRHFARPISFCGRWWPLRLWNCSAGAIRTIHTCSSNLPKRQARSNPSGAGSTPRDSTVCTWY